MNRSRRDSLFRLERLLLLVVVVDCQWKNKPRVLLFRFHLVRSVKNVLILLKRESTEFVAFDFLSLSLSLD